MTIKVPTKCAVCHDDKIIILSDKGSGGPILRVINTKRIVVSKISVDHCIQGITGEKCDYLLRYIRDNVAFSIYVELKGSDIKKAHSQIYNTVRHLGISNEKRIGYVVANRVPRLNSSLQIIMKQLGENLKISIRTLCSNNEISLP